jgi:two-component system, chemotaxis family, sensor kinase Cph1
VLRLADLHILQASENTLQHLGIDALQLLGQPVSSVVGDVLQASLHALLQQDNRGPGVSYAFTLPARSGGPALDVCVHTSDGLAVLEFEATGRANKNADSDFFMLVTAAVSRLQAPSSVQVFASRWRMRSVPLRG